MATAPAAATDPLTTAATIETPAPASQSAEEIAAAAAAADPLNVVPETAEAYGFTVSEKAQGFLGDISNDPAVAAAKAYAKEQGWSQGAFDKNVGGLINNLVEKGLFEPTFDPKAETAALGEHGETRQRDLYTFLDSIKARGEIDDKQYGELAQLVPTAAGVKALEYMRGQFRGGGVNTDGSPAAGAADAKAEAMKDAADPRYNTDRDFKKAADAKWIAAFGGGGSGR